MISRIMKVEVGTLIILDITETESNNCFIIHLMDQRKKVMFLLLHWRQAIQSAHSWHDYDYNWHDFPDLEYPWYDYCIVCSLMTSQVLISKNSLYTFSQSEKWQWIQCIIIFGIWSCFWLQLCNTGYFLFAPDCSLPLSMWPGFKSYPYVISTCRLT